MILATVALMVVILFEVSTSLAYAEILPTILVLRRHLQRVSELLEVERLKRLEVELSLKTVKAEFAALEERYHIDPLTALYNRERFYIVLKNEIARAARNGTDVAVLYMDVDDFKGVNDQYGHKTGDVVLRQVASSLEKSARDYELVARLSGDEFAVILTGTTHEGSVEAAYRFGESVRLDLAKEPGAVSLSIGIARLRQLDGIDTAETQAVNASLVDAADKAMYRAKAAGRGQIRVYGSIDTKEVSGDEGPPCA